MRFLTPLTLAEVQSSKSTLTQCNETFRDTVLAYLYGTGRGFFYTKKSGEKSRDAVPLSH